MKVKRVCECEMEIVEGDIIQTPIGKAYFAGEVVGREDGRTVLVSVMETGDWRVFNEKDCQWVSENDGFYNV